MTVIANPAAGKGRVGRAADRLRAAFPDATLLFTESPGHATQLARRAATNGSEAVVALGGDGTVREVVSGMFESDSALGVLPLGSGNDFARSVGLPLSFADALDVLKRGVIRKTDLGEDSCGMFTCLSGVGFAAEVAHEAIRTRLFKGSAAYFAAVFKALMRLRPVPTRVLLDEETIETEALFVLALNTPYCGGGQRMAPDARIDDGMLDVIVATPVSKLELAMTFPKVYSGRHIEHPAFHVYRSSSARIESDRPMRKLLDGDLVGSEPMESRVHARALKVIVPQSSDS